MGDLTTYQILCLVGIPTIVGLLVGAGWTRIVVLKGEVRAIKLGLQALLRRQLRKEYKHYATKGWVSVEDRDDFENMYTQYHNLGVNGVMDNVHDKFLALPTQPPATHAHN